MDKLNKATIEHRNKLAQNNSHKSLKLRWWQSKPIIKHINRVVCGEEVVGPSQGLIHLVKRKLGNNLPLKSGISPGGGNAQKEIELLRQNIVITLDLYETDPNKVKQGKTLAEQHGVLDRITFISEDIFEKSVDSQKYDLVHWNNSLHHIEDVDQAIKWSWDVLNENGLFYMDDFVGPSRFQWPDEQLQFASRIRQVFEGSKYLVNPKNPSIDLPINIPRPDLHKALESNASEAANSEQIVKALYRYFPDAQFEMTGGVVYHSVLNDMLHNFDEMDDRILLDLLLIIDELYAQLGHTHYGIALAFKAKHNKIGSK